MEKKEIANTTATLRGDREQDDYGMWHFRDSVISYFWNVIKTRTYRISDNVDANFGSLWV